MPPYQHITDYIAQHFNPNFPWRNQSSVIHQIAWMLNSTDILVHRVELGRAIMEGICLSLQNNVMHLPRTRVSQLKENLIRDIEAFRNKPEYWQNIP